MDKQEKYLPTNEALNAMTKNQFITWIEEAFQHLPERENERDPLFHLHNRISKVLKSDVSEEQKEKETYREIKNYFDDCKAKLTEPQVTLSTK